MIKLIFKREIILLTELKGGSLIECITDADDKQEYVILNHSSGLTKMFGLKTKDIYVTGYRNAEIGNDWKLIKENKD